MPHRLLLPGLLLVACSSPPKDSAPPSCQDPASLGREEGYFHAIFPGEDDVVPSDRWLVREGERLQVDWPHPTLESGVGQVDGFPTFTPVAIPFSAPLDPVSLSAERFLLFRFDQGAHEPLPFGLYHNAEDALVYLAPTAPLPEGAHLGVAVLAGVASADGAPLERSAWLDCLLEGWDDPDLALLGEGVGEALGAMEALGADPADLRWLNTFWTASPTARLRRLATAHEAALGSGTLTGGFDHVLEATDADGHLTAEVKALLPADVQPSGTYPYLQTFVQGSLTIPDARWALDLGGLAEPSEAETIPFSLLVPPLEDGGEHPLVVFLHGIACCREMVLSTSSQLGAQGAIVVAIDAREHYVRNDLGADACYSEWYALTFFDFSSLQGTAERFALSASDVYALLLFLERDLGGLVDDLAAAQGLAEAPRVGQVHFLGHSLGGMIGTLTTAMLPERLAGGAMVSSAGGGGLPMIGFPSMWGGFLGEPMAAERLQVLLEFETALALGDPASHAGSLPVDFLIQEVAGDGTMPNVTTELLALMGGLPLVEPAAWDVPSLGTVGSPLAGNLPDGRTGGLVQYAEGDHNFLFHQAEQTMGQAWTLMAEGEIRAAE